MRSRATRGVGLLLLAAALIAAFVHVAERGLRQFSGRTSVTQPRRGRVPPAPRTFPEEFSARVVGVSDGDTITVLHGAQDLKVRLYGIDCPEKGQAYGTRAKLFTAQAVFGRDVTVRAVTRDQYGRIVGEVTLPDGASLNRALVEAGFAWWYREYPSDPELATLEAEARAARRGLWADRSPVPPWEFRSQHRRPRRAAPAYP